MNIIINNSYPNGQSDTFNFLLYYIGDQQPHIHVPRFKSESSVAHEKYKATLKCGTWL